MKVAIGGVDHTHFRPSRKDGSPVRRWELDCDDCGPSLADDVLWSSSKYKIPLTKDEEEENERLNEEANAAIERERMAAARAIAERGSNQHRDSQDEDDEDDAPVTADRDGVEEEPEEPEEQNGGLTVEPVDYSTLGKPELQKLAKDRNLPTSGTKDALIERLAEDDDQPQKSGSK